MTPADYEQARMEHARRVTAAAIAAGVVKAERDRRAYFRRYYLARRVPVPRMPGSHRGKARPVVRSDGTPFPTATAAARACGGRSHTVILRALKLGCVAYGYRWSQRRAA